MEVHQDDVDRKLDQVGLDRVAVVSEIVPPTHTVKREISHPEEDVEENDPVFSEQIQDAGGLLVVG